MKYISIIYSASDSLSTKTADCLLRILDHSGHPVRTVDCVCGKIPSNAVFHILVIHSPMALVMADVLKKYRLQGPVAAIRFQEQNENAEPWTAITGLKTDYEAFCPTTQEFLKALSSDSSRLRVAAESVLTQVVAALLAEMRGKSTAVRFQLNTGRLGGLVLNLLYNLLGKRFIGKAFGVGASCAGCGQCLLACPNKAVRLRGSIPTWSRRCKGCLTCRDTCPQRAIGLSLVRLGVFTIGAFLPYDDWLFMMAGRGHESRTFFNIVVGLLIWSAGFVLFCILADFLLSFLERFGGIRKFFGIFLSLRRPVLLEDKIGEVLARRLSGP